MRPTEAMQDDPIPSRPFFALVAPGICLVLTFITACATAEIEETDLERVRDLIRHGQFVEAVGHAAQLAEDRPEDGEAVLLHRDATVAYLLARGRQKTFEGRDTDALEDFEIALQMDPSSQPSANWIDKTKRKLASEWFGRARAAHALENFEGARQAYETAIAYQPDHLGSTEGLARVSIQQNYRANLSDSYYNEGLRAVTEWRLDEAKHGFQGSGKYGQNVDRAERRISEIDQKLAVQRVMVATQAENEGFYGAARNDYRVATILDPSNELAQEGFERSRVEAEVERLLEQGNLWVQRGNFAKGRESMEEALKQTVRQGEKIKEAIAGIRVARSRKAYQAALDLEHDFRLEDAITAYQGVIDEFGYDLAEDSQARITTLGDYVRDAKELYAEAKAASGDKERLDILRQIEVFWPEYLDIGEQIEALE